MPFGARARGSAEPTRPGNAVAAGILTFTGVLVAGVAPSDALVVVAAMFATVFAAGAGNAINGYFDRDTDRINRLNHPIPRGAATVLGAKWFSVTLFGGVVVSVSVLPVAAIAIIVVNLVTLPAYAEFFRSLPGVGDVVVAAFTDSTPLFGGAAIGEPLGAAVFCVLVTLTTPIREIVKDVEDIGGDREGGSRTLLIIVDGTASLWLGAAALVAAVGASAVPFVREEFGLAYLDVAVPADAPIPAAITQSFGNPVAAQRRPKHGTLPAAFVSIFGWATASAGGLL